MENLSNRDIFIIEDDENLLNELKDYLSKNNNVLGASTYSSALNILKSFSPDIVLLDILLPDGNGLDLIPIIKPDTPIIILSDLGSEENIVEGLRSGASDYMVKPYSFKVLEERIKLRLLPEDKAIINKHNLKLNTRNRTVFYNNTPIQLTTNEFDILYFLMSNPGKFYTSDEIYENVWKLVSLNTGTVRYHMHNLRKKMLNVSLECSELIITKFGGGYAFMGD